MNKRYMIRTYDYGNFWRYAKGPLAAKYLVASLIYGHGWKGTSAWENVDNWEVIEA